MRVWGKWRVNEGIRVRGGLMHTHTGYGNKPSL